MSGEIKILFYIIAGIIYLISTFYKKEKRKQHEKDVTRKPMGNSTAEDIFEELKKSIVHSDEPKPVVQVPEKMRYKKMARKPEVSINYDQYLKKKKAPAENTFIEEAHFVHHQEVEIRDIVESEEIRSEIDFINETSPRKAFMYAEIFKRPQY